MLQRNLIVVEARNALKMHTTHTFHRPAKHFYINQKKLMQQCFVFLKKCLSTHSCMIDGIWNSRKFATILYHRHMSWKKKLIINHVENLPFFLVSVLMLYEKFLQHKWNCCTEFDVYRCLFMHSRVKRSRWKIMKNEMFSKLHWSHWQISFD